MTPGRIESLADARAYVAAGAGRFTLVSKRTGDRRTFRLRAPPAPVVEHNGPAWFVDVLTGPDNTSDYTYLAFLTRGRDGVFRAKQNKKGWGRIQFEALAWLLRQFNRAHGHGDSEFAKCEFWHDGTCARCGRDLTTPESVARGLGPTCAGVA